MARILVKPEPLTKTERLMEITPAFDKRDPDPRKNYGIHGAEMRFTVKGPLGAVSFLLYTNWQLPHIEREFREKERAGESVLRRPIPADLGYHSPFTKPEEGDK
jgi:hypothetical protein